MSSLGNILSVLCAACLLSAGVAGAEGPLPEGPDQAALVSEHFPDRLHEFVWRNWNAVAPAKLAAIVGATEPEIVAIAVSMGLPEQADVPPEMLRRGYATLIRRNWHLLPYEQLTQLVEMTPEQLGFTLREEDFLWVKLGRLKPRCEPLRYTPPNGTTQQRAAEIKALVDQEFGSMLRQPAEPRFDFVRQLSTPAAGMTTPSESAPGLRIVYSYVAVYGDPLLNAELNPYPDGLLQRLAQRGINGVWLQGLLRDLAPGGETFPEFGKGHQQRLENLRSLVQRAKQQGIGVYLYLNEPRGMHTPFFETHPDLAGVSSGGLTALCTSQPAVRAWMADTLAYIFREVPELAGVYAITASENLTNCASHGDWASCPRCKQRGDADILSEVVATIEEGVHRSSPSAQILISDWGWRGHGDAPDIIARLPKAVTLMSVSEWHLPIERGGVKSTVGEYSISSVGPGPRAQGQWKVALDTGLPIGTEIQFNNTCEIASLPYIPVMDLVAEHCSNLASRHKLDAMLIGWTMGGYPSPNFQLAQQFSREPVPTLAQALDTVALERFGPDGAQHARKAWTQMSNGFREYPFHISVVYTSPVQWGSANPMYGARTGYSATMWGIPYDDLNGWRGPYPPDVFAKQFEKVADGFRTGIEEFALAVEKSPPAMQDEAKADLRLARAAANHFQAVANQSRYVAARNELAEQTATLPAEAAAALRSQMQGSLEDEIKLAHELFQLTREDSRIGFEPSCQYFYLPLDLVEKVINCRWLLAQLQN